MPYNLALNLGVILTLTAMASTYVVYFSFQVFAALIFLYDLYKSEPFAQNPFAAVFVKYLQVRLP